MGDGVFSRDTQASVAGQNHEMQDERPGRCLGRVWKALEATETDTHGVDEEKKSV